MPEISRFFGIVIQMYHRGMEPRAGEAGPGEDRSPPLIYWDIVEARVVDDYCIWMRFATASRGW